MKIYLDGAWRLSYTDPDNNKKVSLGINVPGNVETALFENGITGDFMPADDIFSHEKYDWVDDWTFSRAFTAPEVKENEQLFLNFEGIDTVADICLNGRCVFHVRNMFRPFHFDITNMVKAGENELTVVIKSPLKAAMETERAIGTMFTQPRNFLYGGQSNLRKARHEWGWDNAPRLLTAGIYRSVYLETLPQVRFDEVYVYTKAVRKADVIMGVSYKFLTDSDAPVGYSVRVTATQDGRVIGSSEERAPFPKGVTQLFFSRDEVKLWWPRGYGEQSFVEVKTELIKDGVTVAENSTRYGLRELRLEYTDCVDENNNGEFTFICNGEKIYINGTNWKPLDALHSRADAKVEEALKLALDLNCNTVRIWGGGIYEDTPFFDFCDENGLLVWQDFMFACEVTPADDFYIDNVCKECAAIIKKLRNHPCLAVWCGDNENDISLGWGTYYGTNILPSDMKISREVLPKCVLAHDPYRTYVPSSPFISDRIHLTNKKGDFSIQSTETHLYPAAVNYASALRSCKSRFIGETGPIGINPMTDNERIFEKEKKRAERLWNAPKKWEADAHQNDGYFTVWRQTGRENCLVRYGRDFSFEEIGDYRVALNLVCGEIYKDAIEYCRSERPNKTGVIWWSLIDMWPMLFNYSIVDSDFKKKEIPYYWIKQSQQSTLLSVVRKNGSLGLYTANDTLSEKNGEYKITAVASDGAEREVKVGTFKAEKNASARVSELSEGEGQELFIIEWNDGDGVHYNHFITGKGPYDFKTQKAWSERLLKLYKN